MAEALTGSVRSTALSVVRRLLTIWPYGFISAVISWYYWGVQQGDPSDFAQTWTGARALLAGQNPYEAVGPGRAMEYRWLTPYPLPAFLLALPFTPLPMRLVDPLFTGLSAAALAFVLTRDRPNDPRLLVFASMAYVGAVQYSQWSPLLTAAVFLPWLSPVLAAKPTIGAALWLAYPSGRTLAGAIALLLLSFVAWPTWPWSWYPTLAGLTHLRMPITFWGGPLILLALLRWRLPEARLLVALSCVPQTTFLYEAIPLFLIPRTIKQAAYLATATHAVQLLYVVQLPYPSYDVMAATMGQWMVYLLYLPCVAMVLRRRPQHSEDRAIVDAGDCRAAAGGQQD